MDEELIGCLIDIIEEMLCEKKVLTADLGGSSSTSEVGDEVIRRLKDRMEVR